MWTLIRDPQGQTFEAHFRRPSCPTSRSSNISQILHVVEKEWLAMVYFEGDQFEMEDQRNWSDGSFKSYCPPQARPKPRRLEAGSETHVIATRSFQSPDNKPISDLAAALAAAGLFRPADAPAPLLKPRTDDGKARTGVRLRLGQPRRVPASADLGPHQGLVALPPPGRFPPGPGRRRAELERAVAQARALSIPLECALVLPKDEGKALAEFAKAWDAAEGECLRWLIFSEASDATAEEDLQAARDVLGQLDPSATFARGSKSDFVLLNRNRPDPKPGMALAYGLCPQVHLSDNRTLVESLEGQAWTLITAAKTWPRSKVSVTPITLKRSPFSVALKAPPEPGKPVWPRALGPIKWIPGNSPCSGRGGPWAA